MTGLTDTDEKVLWRNYSSWAQFTWLYLVSLVLALRGLLYLIYELPGWQVWLSGAVMLLTCAAFLRRWALYTITSRRVIMTNGYTGREIQAVTADSIGEVSIKQGVIARLLGIGTVTVRSASGEQVLWLRGIKDAEAIQSRIEALRPVNQPRVNQRVAP